METKENPTLQAYKDAVWDFLVEHSDILPSGAYFFKFHASDRRNVENRIQGRLKYGYHREDTKEKQGIANVRRHDFESKKEEKARRWENDRIRRKKMKLKIWYVGRVNTIRAYFRRFFIWE